MPYSNQRSRFFITLTVGIILTLGSVLAIQIAKGYRPNLKQMSLNGMGLLSSTSYPKSAQVFVNDRLSSVTDDTLYLNPGTYQVKIIKNGYNTWSKTIPVKAEIVSITDARLFPAIPSSNPLTFYKIDSPLISPDGSKIIYLQTNSPFDTDNGLYVMSFSNTIIGDQVTQVSDLASFDYSKTEFLWSPDSSQILALSNDGKKVISARLLNPKILNTTKNLVDQTIRLPLILNQWRDQVDKIHQNRIKDFPDFITKIASSSSAFTYFSPDTEKILYSPTIDQELPDNDIGKNLLYLNPTKQARSLNKGKTYIFDRKEVTNYLIDVDNPINQPKTKTDEQLTQFYLLKRLLDPISTQNLSWFSDSNHILIRSDSGVNVIDYDGLNNVSLTSSILKNRFALSTPDGNRLIVLSNLNQKTDLYNLISLNLK